MTKKEHTNPETNQNKVQEPATAFKAIRVFHSFEEENEFEAKRSATLSHDKRMEHVEILRRQVFGNYLLSNGTWPPVSKAFKIMKPYINDPGK